VLWCSTIVLTAYFGVLQAELCGSVVDEYGFLHITCTLHNTGKAGCIWLSTHHSHIHARGIIIYIANKASPPYPVAELKRKL
jgi:hypothetical protein